MLVLAVAGADAPKPESTVVQLTKRGGATAERAAEASAAVEKALAVEGVAFAMAKDELAQRLSGLGVKSASDCDGKKKCVLELASQLVVPSVVAVSVAQVGTDLSVHAELLSSAGGAKLADDTIVAPVKALAELANRFAPFAQRVHAAMAPKKEVPVVAKVEPAPKPVDAPVKAPEAKLMPAPPPPPMVVSEAPSRTPALVAGGLGVIALGVGAGFLVSALGDKSQVDASATNLQGVQTSVLSGSEAQALASSANGKLTAALISAAVGVAAAGVAAVLWGGGAPAGK
jgi:hypothetical protein